MHYTDDSGLDVTTTIAAVEHDIDPHVTLRGRYWSDFIVAGGGGSDVAPASGSDGSDGEHVHEPDPIFQGVAPSVRLAQDSHDHGGVDAVTAASTVVSRGTELRKRRHEGLVGVDVRPGGTEVPLTLGVLFRSSYEPDFGSTSGVVRGQVDLFEQHTTVGGFVGLARDEVRPLEVPPGQQNDWPAAHSRWITGLSVSQILSRSVVASAGGMVVLQQGRLANPYRRALVRSTQFSEVVPDRRNRWLGFGQLSWHLGWDTALHGRLSFYLDSWGVEAVVPEAAVLKELGGGLLLSLAYRFYTQSRADFYAPRYDELQAFLSGDPRLGRITDHTGRLELTWTLLGTPEVAGALSTLAGYALSRTTYADLTGTPIYAHMPSVGLSLVY